MKWNEVVAKDSSVAQDIAAMIGTGSRDYYIGFLHALKLAEDMGSSGFSTYFTENKLQQFRAYAEWRLQEKQTIGPASTEKTKEPRQRKVREVT